MNKKRNGLILSLLGIISIVLITVGVTYAFFNYAKEGSTENSMTTGTITFLYTEVSGVGNGISISDAYPTSDEIGKAQVGSGNIFDFKVTSNTPNNASIPYEVTARMKADSTLEQSAVKLYLVKLNGNSEEEVLLDNYSNLTQTDKVDVSKYIEKVIYKGKVPTNSTKYEQAFRLRMWIDESVDFSPNEDGTYPYNGKTFTITVNVYANAKVVTGSDIALESNANISSLFVNGEALTKVEEYDYDYETSLPEGITSTTINVETESPYATVNIEKIDSLAYQEASNIQRLSTAKTVELDPGVNNFKVTITSENKAVTQEYKIKISVEKGKVVLKDEILKVNSLIVTAPTLTTSSNNTSDASGLYKSTATNTGEPTYYFRGAVENNYVSFAGFNWRIIRINEDGTIRLIKDSPIAYDKFNLNGQYNYTYMYYSNSDFIKDTLETWYTTNIASDANYSSKVVSGEYYCEQAKVSQSSSYGENSGVNMTVYSSYIPNFKCETDINGKGILNASVGLITYDELVFAGGYYRSYNNKYYLYGGAYWTMSPAGVSGDGIPYEWYLSSTGDIWFDSSVYSTNGFKPVINLNVDTTVTGAGTSTDPYVVQ